MRVNKLFILILVLILLAACGTNKTTPTEPQANSETVTFGKTVFQANCSACHSTTNENILVGPSLLGLADRAGKIVPGLDARAYIEQSIKDPGAFVNEVFQNIMPATYSSSLSPDQLEAVVAYLLTFE